jgi:hypothetical protein
MNNKLIKCILVTSILVSIINAAVFDLLLTGFVVITVGL